MHIMFWLIVVLVVSMIGFVISAEKNWWPVWIFGLLCALSVFTLFALMMIEAWQKGV